MHIIEIVSALGVKRLCKNANAKNVIPAINTYIPTKNIVK